MAKMPNYEHVAKRQRGLLFVVLVLLLSSFAMFIMPAVLGGRNQILIMPIFATYWLALLAGLVMSILLMVAERKNIFVIVLLSLLLFLPLINLLVLLHINSQATLLLKYRGVKVGLLGAPKAEWGKLRVGHCRGCGYDRSGLEILAQCPECGRIPEVG